MPSAAERTRTLVQSTCSALLVVPGLNLAGAEPLLPDSRSVGPEGDVFLEFPADSPAVRAATHAQGDDLTAVLEITDVAPVSVPHRVRGRAWISGWLTSVPGIAEPGRMMLRLEFGEAYVDDLWGAEDIEAEDFRDAAPDPLVVHETELLQHLAASHGEQMRTLCGLLGERDTGTFGGHSPRAVPVALDRFGLRVRFIENRNSCFDARFEFPEPVRDVTELRRAMHTLFEAAAL
ncbi:DUF2470 domain-containing protein [Streptomyces sp. RB110-1]|uniref:DUF2470 domain-containing protein n=1 Tax=unclassified Streptomyces TaxID=2593676 RepID=UPI001902374E|nr:MULTISPECIES: DUF2470 domain-containing protein [unclassified Streptomyces]MBK0371408.1 DUF2470 domain-containing protein [Streptomyces sp. RB110-1]MBK0385460.1 DUF2470 domain-containing protein [Streptomyces sp. RB110-2]